MFFLSAGFVWSFICGYLLIPTLAQAFLSYSIKAEFKMDRWQPFICKKGLLWIQSVTHSYEGSFFATKGLGHHYIKYDDDVRLFQQFVKKEFDHNRRNKEKKVPFYKLFQITIGGFCKNNFDAAIVKVRSEEKANDVGRL